LQLLYAFFRFGVEFKQSEIHSKRKLSLDKSAKQFLIFLMLAPVSVTAQFQSEIIYFEGERLVYVSDDEGNRIPDYSHAGYRGGGVPLPDVPVKETLDPLPGDNRSQIQRAINRVGNLPKDENGIRGAVKLNPGIYTISRRLNIRESGVVLKGSGSGEDSSENSVIRVSSNVQDAAILIGNERTLWYAPPEERIHITSEFIPVGSRTFEVEDATPFQPGDNVIIRQHSTPEWIEAVDGGGTEGAPAWEPEQLDIYYNRKITDISGNSIAIDAPVLNHLDRNLAQSVIYKPSRGEPVKVSGVENLRIQMQSQHPAADNHTLDGVLFYGANHSWARDVTVLHFRRSAFKTRFSAHITVTDSRALEPHSPLSGERRYNFNSGLYSNNILFKNITSTNGRRDFISNGTSVASGVVFLNAVSVGALGSSEGHQKWTHGLLYDNVRFEDPVFYNVLSLHNRGDFGSSHGWSAAHSTAWNVDAGDHYIFIQKPPGAQNYGIGNKGRVSGRGLFDFPEGYIEGTGEEVNPESLYQAQLRERMEFGVPPDAPAWLTVSDEKMNQLILSWQHSSLEPVEFLIERSSDDADQFETVAAVFDKKTYVDHDIKDRTYVYRVRASDGSGNSAYSNPASGKPEFDIDAISDFSLQLPLSNSEFMIDGEPEDHINFLWDDAASSFDITYSFYVDRVDGDFAAPAVRFDSLSSSGLSLSFSEIDQIFDNQEVAVGDTLNAKWRVKASGHFLEKWADEEHHINLIRGKKVDYIDEEDQIAQLDQNYPNPFNPKTTIRYHLDEASRVTLEVFDLHGARIAKLENGEQPRGTHTILFDASSLASGIYLYRLTTGQYVETRKMMLIK
jgi:hypothetical protein